MNSTLKILKTQENNKNKHETDTEVKSQVMIIRELIIQEPRNENYEI